MGALNQRWRERREHYRPAGEPIDTSRYEVAELTGPGSDTVAKAFVCQHHYSATYPAARFRFGLYRSAELVGAAVFSHPSNDAVLTNVFPELDATAAVVLGRFVLLDDVPGNGETWFLARAFHYLRGRVAGVVSFSDPEPRRAADGTVVHPGHVGTIYQAGNGVYLGRSRRNTVHLLPDGTVFDGRTIQKIRTREQGWQHSAGKLVEFGAAPLDAKADARAWLHEWLPKLTVTRRHPGNHRYAWALERRLRRGLRAVGPYPKRDGFQLVPSGC